MPIEKTSIEGLLIVRWNALEDERGFFKHTYQHEEISRALGRDLRLRQGNHSRSRARVLRGFHAEPWDKLIYVVRGLATCVIADIRPDSPRFGTCERFLLGDPPGERIRLFVGTGLANAFYCHTETDYLNDVSEAFDPSNRQGIAWNDPTLGVAWEDSHPILSRADSAQPLLSDIFHEHPRFAAP